METPARIPEKLFFRIGEVCDLIKVQPHVLRYWETEFPMLAPEKNRAGQRVYRRRDVEMVMRIRALLYEEKFTIAGAKKKLQEEMHRGGSRGRAENQQQAPAVEPSAASAASAQLPLPVPASAQASAQSSAPAQPAALFQPDLPSLSETLSGTMPESGPITATAAPADSASHRDPTDLTPQARRAIR